MPKLIINNYLNINKFIIFILLIFSANAIKLSKKIPIESAKNISSLYNDQIKLFYDKFYMYSRNIDKIYLPLISKNKNLFFMNKIKGFNISVCLEISKASILTESINTIDDNDKCLKNQITLFDNSLFENISSNYVQSAFTQCYDKKNQPTVKNIIKCIDENMNIKNETKIKVYKNITNTLKNNNNSMILSMNHCIENVMTLLTQKLNNITNKFNTCVKKQPLMMFHELIDVSTTIDLAEWNESLTSIYNDQKIMFPTIESSYNNMLINNTNIITNNFKSIINISSNDKINCSCCYNLPQQYIDEIAKLTIHETNQCFTNQTSSLNKIIMSAIQADNLSSSLKHCYKNSMLLPKILECFDENINNFQLYQHVRKIILDKIYQSILSILNCIDNRTIFFDKHVNHASDRFEICVNYQKIGNACVLHPSYESKFNWMMSFVASAGYIRNMG